MMTPPTPHDQSTPHGLGLGVLLGRPASRSSLTPLDGGSSRPTSSASTLEPERRRSAGSGFLRDKLSTLTHRMSRQGSAIKDDEDGAAATAAAASRRRCRRYRRRPRRRRVDARERGQTEEDELGARAHQDGLRAGHGESHRERERERERWHDAATVVTVARRADRGQLVNVA